MIYEAMEKLMLSQPVIMAKTILHRVKTTYAKVMRVTRLTGITGITSGQL